MARSEFVDWLVEQLAPMGPITARSMFGGWGVYCHGIIFSIVVDDVAYLKTDATTEPRFEQAGSGPFRYSMHDGREMKMAYWRIPDDVMEDRGAMIKWSREALDVSLRAQKAKPPKKPKAAKTSKAKAG
ncbi:MAG: TfoX/Sxy family protein [Burkholderiales bacterium]|nr:TfoX/Sxy family protein [Burkholderiales bacterium]